ncbi:MAG: acryloyl-CoA reductase [Chthoniobacter sp.]
MKGDWLVPLPPGLTLNQAMAIGTAGFTAMLCVLALEDHAIDRAGEIVVTGATGGVGSMAISLLARRGWKVVASTGRVEQEADYLRRLGAAEIVPRQLLSKPSVRPLETERWAGAVDSVGGETLAGILRQMRYGGSVTACGLAGGMNLPASVLPFILRGVNLLGIDSVQCPRPLRERAWQRLAAEVDFDLLEQMTTSIVLPDVLRAAHDLLAGKLRGRTVVTIE